jgi:hypothetical protein
MSLAGPTSRPSACSGDMKPGEPATRRDAKEHPAHAADAKHASKPVRPDELGITGL